MVVANRPRTGIEILEMAEAAVASGEPKKEAWGFHTLMDNATESSDWNAILEMMKQHGVLLVQERVFLRFVREAPADGRKLLDLSIQIEALDWLKAAPELKLQGNDAPRNLHRLLGSLKGALSRHVLVYLRILFEHWDYVPAPIKARIEREHTALWGTLQNPTTVDEALAYGWENTFDGRGRQVILELGGKRITRYLPKSRIKATISK